MLLIKRKEKPREKAHIVESVDRVVVEFTEGKQIPAEVIASVVAADVALIKLEWIPPDAVIARLGDSDKAEAGDQVFVIGAPYGLSRTLTAGHLSARHTHKQLVGGLRAIEMLQTDAAVNKGNSGGPVFNKIHARLSALRPGSQLIVKVLRGGKVIDLSAEVAKK